MAKTKAKVKAKTKAKSKAASKKVVKLSSKKPVAKANGLPKPSTKPYGQAGRALDGVKILGVGELKAKLAFEVYGASKSAVEAIEKAGGSVKILAAASQA